MKRVLWTVAMLALGAAALIGGETNPRADVLADADRAFAKATAERGLDGFTSFLAGNAMTLRPDSPVIIGRDELAKRWAPLLNDPAARITWQPLHAEIARSGDLGYTVGSYQITRTEAGVARVAGSGKYVTIWRKQRDGSWKVEFDSGVQDTQPATE
jgi:ketosteroid isomerase-like protein